VQTSPPELEEESLTPQAEEKTTKPRHEERPAKPRIEEKTMKARLDEKTAKPRIEEKAAKSTLEIVRLPAGGTQAAKPGTASSRASAGFEPGELVQLLIKPSRDAHIYCYLQDETRQILRFYPNRFSGGSVPVKATAPLELPGKMGFELVANALKVKETVTCFATERNVMPELPAAVTGTDFEHLPVTSLDEVKRAFARVAGDQLAQARFLVEFK
jgi:hypothetical protein